MMMTIVTCGAASGLEVYGWILLDLPHDSRVMAAHPAPTSGADRTFRWADLGDGWAIQLMWGKLSHVWVYGYWLVEQLIEQFFQIIKSS